MAYVLRVRLGDVELGECTDPEFNDWVKTIEHASLDDPDINERFDSHAGMFFTNRDKLTFKIITGRLLARQAFYHLRSTYKICIDSIFDDVPAMALGKILTRAADSCVFSKIGNHFLFQYFRGYLSPPRCALLNVGETPFKEIGEQLDDECNKIVRPITDTLCKDQFIVVDWKTCKDALKFILAACILKEIIDDEVTIFVNTEMSYAEEKDVPCLFASTSFDPFDLPFGIIESDKKHDQHNSHVWYTDVDYSVYCVLIQYINRRASDGNSFSKILECCELEYDQIEATNPFKKYTG